MKYTGAKAESHYDNSHVYLMDCMDALRQTPDKYFDLAVVDPPYGINISSSENIGYGEAIDYRTNKKMNAKRNKWDIKDWDSRKPDITYFKELLRTSKNQVIWGINC